jgi:hypothetical protein
MNEIFVIPRVSKEDFDLFLVDWWFQVEDDFNFSHVGFYPILAYNMAQQYAYKRGKDALFDV